MSEVVASLEVALALQEKKDSSVIDEDVCDFGEIFDNGEIEGSSNVLSDIAYTDSSSSIILKLLPPNSPIGQSERTEKPFVPKYTLKKNMLVLFEGTNCAFDLEDLLRAEAEMLGKGAYKAELEDSTILVVKRLKELGVKKRKFKQQMEVVGSIRYENVAPLRAYYYSKDKKLMVYDYYNQANRGKGRTPRTPLDWETRLRIAIGTARGIAYIHTQTGGKLVHGNIKAPNIFLNSQQHGCVSEHGDGGTAVDRDGMHRKRCKAETEDDRCGENGGRYSKEIKSEVSTPTPIQLTAAEIVPTSIL
ncbi:hypothetical protein LguiB_026750 [Lonicera macranthoides]